MVSLTFFDYGFDLIEIQAHLDAIASVAVLAWFDYPGVVLFGSFLLFIFIYSLCSFVIILKKFKILGVLQALLDVECQRQIRKYILSSVVIVIRHGVE